MRTDLSSEQRVALKQDPGKPLQVVDSVTHSSYVLIPDHSYQRVKALIEEDEFNVREMSPLMDEVARNEGWADPSMDAYDALDPRRGP
jgi:hypothetical protein